MRNPIPPLLKILSGKLIKCNDSMPVDSNAAQSGLAERFFS